MARHADDATPLTLYNMFLTRLRFITCKHSRIIVITHGPFLHLYITKPVEVYTFYIPGSQLIVLLSTERVLRTILDTYFMASSPFLRPSREVGLPGFPIKFRQTDANAPRSTQGSTQKSRNQRAIEKNMVYIRWLSIKVDLFHIWSISFVRRGKDRVIQ